MFLSEYGIAALDIWIHFQSPSYNQTLFIIVNGMNVCIQPQRISMLDNNDSIDIRSIMQNQLPRENLSVESLILKSISRLDGTANIGWSSLLTISSSHAEHTGTNAFTFKYIPECTL